MDGTGENRRGGSSGEESSYDDPTLPEAELEPTLPTVPERGPEPETGPEPAAEGDTASSADTAPTVVTPSPDSGIAETLVTPVSSGSGPDRPSGGVEPPPSRSPRTPGPSAAAPTRIDAGEPDTVVRHPHRMIADRFEVLSKLGEGGMGKVYHVRDRQIPDRQLALKVLNERYSSRPKFRDLFFQEVRAAQEFVSEHVNQVRDTGQTADGQLYLTMDLVKGQSLRDLLRRENSLHERHALEVARQVLLGLQSGHEHGLIHRDVKPENVMLAARIPKTDDNPYGVGARLLDFGLAGLAAELGEDSIAGTPMYMSPEQAQGQRLDARSDLFAVGVVLYEMISGTRPFHGKSVENIISSVIETDVQPLIDQLDHLSEPVQKILRKALEKKREDRYQSASDFVRAIETSRAYLSPVGMPKWAAAGLVLLGLTTVASGGLFVLENKQSGDLQSDLNEAEGRADKWEADYVAKESELNKAREEFQARLDELQSQDIEQGDVESSLGSRVAILEKASEQQELQILDLQEEKRLLSEQLLNKDTQLQEQNLRLNELSNYRQLEEQRRDPIYRSAVGMGPVLRLLENGLGRRGRDAFYSLRGEEAFLEEELAGADFLAAVSETAAALEEYSVSGDEFVRSQALSVARARHADAMGLRESFPVLAADWLERATEDEPEPRRLERLDELLASQGQVLDSAEAATADKHETDWQTLVALDPVSGSRDALRHVNEHACSHAKPFLAGWAPLLGDLALVEGRLSPDGLRSAGALTDWSEYLERTPALLPNPDARTVLTYGYAQRWYDQESDNDAFDWKLVDVAESSLGEVDDWIAELWIKHRLVQPGCAFPNVPGRVLVYRTLRSGGRVSWEIERLEAGPDSPSPNQTSWTISQDLRDENGDKLSSQSVIRKLHRYGRSFRLDESVTPVLDLSANAGMRVGLFEREFHDELPRQLPPTDSALANFRAGMDRDPVPCLVVEDGSRTVWISPRYGLVREVRFGADSKKTKEKELVFASSVY